MYEHLLSTKGLSVERLHALVLLSEHGSLIKAAKGDPSVQSRYSHYLRELSGFAGKELTEKDGRSIKLTAAGQELAALAKHQFQALHEYRSRVSGSIQQVYIGAGDSLLPWLVIPAVGALRLLGTKQGIKVENLRTGAVVQHLQEQRLHFGLVRHNAVTEGLASEEVCVVRYIIVVPRRIAPRRLDLRTALLECPHAMVGGDGELVNRLHALAAEHSGGFQPALVCDSYGQCMAAVRTGAYAAVLPTQVWQKDPDLDCEVVDEESLAELDRPIDLAWSPRNLEVLGAGLDAFRTALASALIEEATHIGMVRR